MKKLLFLVLLLAGLRANAQVGVAAIIQAGIKKIIVALDLRIQRLQNKTLLLQNAQKVVENNLSETKLVEISGWLDRQKNLYKGYFEELGKVKEVITYYSRVKDIIADQLAMVKEYQLAWALFRQDKNFTADEKKFMSGVYEGMMQESVKNIDQLFLVIGSFTTQMSDAKRMEIIHRVAAKSEEVFFDLKRFNNQNKTMSLQRSFERGDIEYSRKIYGL